MGWGQRNYIGYSRRNAVWLVRKQTKKKSANKILPKRMSAKIHRVSLFFTISQYGKTNYFFCRASDHAFYRIWCLRGTRTQRNTRSVTIADFWGWCSLSRVPVYGCIGPIFEWWALCIRNQRNLLVHAHRYVFILFFDLWVGLWPTFLGSTSFPLFRSSDANWWRN